MNNLDSGRKSVKNALGHRLRRLDLHPAFFIDWHFID
jgi:hypothetical protein